MNIQTKRLIITEFTMDMAMDVHLNSLDEDNRKFVPDEVFETVEVAEKTLEFLISQYGKETGPYVYPILLKDQANIGYIQLVALKEGWEIGYHIAKKYTGNGYATEALEAFLPVITEQKGLSEVWGIVLADNNASRKVLERCGFTKAYEGMGLYQGEERELCRYIFYAGCPRELLELAKFNDHTRAFVKNYSKNKDTIPAERMNLDLKENEIPAFYQWDESWGHISYGTSYMAKSGCGPTCLSMVIMGLTHDYEATPCALARYSEKKELINEENNTLWKLFTDGAADWNLNCAQGILCENDVLENLAKGNPIICSVRPGDFTTSGHFIVLRGVRQGQIEVNDPFSVENSNRTWAYEKIADQIKEMWVFSR